MTDLRVAKSHTIHKPPEFPKYLICTYPIDIVTVCQKLSESEFDPSTSVAWKSKNIPRDSNVPSTMNTNWGSGEQTSTVTRPRTKTQERHAARNCKQQGPSFLFSCQISDRFEQQDPPVSHRPKISQKGPTLENTIRQFTGLSWHSVELCRQNMGERRKNCERDAHTYVCISSSDLHLCPTSPPWTIHFLPWQCLALSHSLPLHSRATSCRPNTVC